MDSKPLFTTMILWLILSSVLLDYTEGFLFKESTTRASRRKRTKHQQRKKRTNRETQKKTKQQIQKDASLRKMAISVLNSWTETEEPSNRNRTLISLRFNNTLSANWGTELIFFSFLFFFFGNAHAGLTGTHNLLTVEKNQKKRS